jgi:hypothetical protein
MFLHNAMMGRFAKITMRGIALACVFLPGVAFAQTTPSPATMPAPMIAPVPVEIPVPIPSTITAPSQSGGQEQPSSPPDQPDLPCRSADEDEAASGVGATRESRIERRAHGGCE